MILPALGPFLLVTWHHSQLLYRTFEYRNSAYIVDGQGVLIVAVANVAAEVLLVGTAVDDTLCI